MRALAAMLLVAGCAATPPEKPPAPVDRTVALRVAAEMAVAGFAHFCMGGVGRPAVMVERLKADGFTATALPATAEAPIARDVWAGQRRPFLVLIAQGGAACTVSAPLVDAEHGAALLARAMQRAVDDGGPVVPLLVPAHEAPGDGAREERYQIRPRSGPLVMEIRMRVNPPGQGRPTLIMIAAILRDNATRT